jgi:hypothetical protein
MKRLVGVLVLVTVLAACAGPFAASAPSPPVVPSTPADVAPSASVATFVAVTVRGTGPETAPLAIPDGAPAIATFVHPDDAAFAVDALSAAGTVIERLVDVPGRYSGTVLLDPTLEPVLALRIVTAGSWTATIAPLASARSWDGLGKLDGTGDDVILVEPPTVAVTPWHVVHTGASGFVVLAYAAGGSDAVIQQTGDYEGDIRVVAGTYLLTVRSEGRWSFYLLV